MLGEPTGVGALLQLIFDLFYVEFRIRHLAATDPLNNFRALPTVNHQSTAALYVPTSQVMQGTDGVKGGRIGLCETGI